MEGISVSVLREMFRNLAAFRSLYEDTGQEVIKDPSGREWSILDLEYLLEQARERLPRQQRLAIELCLVHNVKESEAAVLMGVAASNPVAVYATLGLKKMVRYIEAGQLPRFRAEPKEATG
jgi:DNA-directed RNA polymerase specialized sigma24 family protein